MSSILKFGPFELDRQNFELRHNGEPVKLDQTPLELLLFFAERAGTLVTRGEAVEHIWGKDVFVETDTSLYTAIRKIRKALNDDVGEPRFIQTVSRKGYRFIATVQEVPHSPPQQDPAGADSTSAPLIAATPADPMTGAAGGRTAQRLIWIAAVCVLLAMGIILAVHLRLRHTASKVTLVVLPLENLSGEPQQEYLADGITEEITTELGSLNPDRLGVLARTSAMTYKHSQKSARQISQELGVTYLLEGSIRRSGPSIRITAQLIQSSDQTHLWAKSYDRELSDVLEVESEIALLVAREIQLKLSEQSHERLTKPKRVDPEAHDAYLRGLHGWNERNRNGFLQAITDFRRATELDADNAPAFAGLARVYTLAPTFAGIPASESAPKALEAANRALAIDGTLADAYISVGFVEGHYQFNWPAANREFRRAIELEPNNPNAHFFYSNSYLSPFGRHEEAIAEMKKALELDPLSKVIQSFAGRTFIWARRYGNAFAQFQKANQLDPSFALNHQRLAQLYAAIGRYDDAIAEEMKARLLSGERQPQVVAKMDMLRRAVRARGAPGYWDAELQIETNGPNPPESYSRPYGIAIIYAHLGQIDKAFANLETAYRQRDAQMSEIAVEPQFDSLRADARFADLKKRVGLPSP